MASMDTSTRDTLPGAQVALALQHADRRTATGQWLTRPLGPTLYSAQTQPVQPLARACMLVDFDHAAFADDTEQTFQAVIPADQLDIVGALTVVVNAPSIANQTATRVDKRGVRGGVSSIAATLAPAGGEITAFSTWQAHTATPGNEDTWFAIGRTYNIVFDNLSGQPDNALISGSGFAGTLTRVAIGVAESAFTVNITNGGSLYTNGDVVTFRLGGKHINDFRVQVTLAANALGNSYDGTAVSFAIDAPPAGGLQATASGARVPADVAAVAAGFDITVDNPGYGYASAPAVSITGGGFGEAVAGTATLTSNSTGENLRYIVPGAPSGRRQAAIAATDTAIADPAANAAIGTAILVESDVDRTYGNVAKAVAGLTFPAGATDANYHNALDGAGVRDLAAYYTPYAPALLFTDVRLTLSNNLLAACSGEHILHDAAVFARQGKRPHRSLHATADTGVAKRWSAQPNLQWHVPLPLFTREVQSMFPACAVRGQTLKLVCKTRRWTDVVCNGTGGAFAAQAAGASSIAVSGATATTVKLEPAAAAASAFLASTFAATTTAGSAVAAADFTLQLLVEGYLVAEDARAAMQATPMIIPFVQHRTMDDYVAPVASAAVPVTVDVPWVLPTTAVHCAGRLKSSELLHRWDDFSGAGDPLSATAAHPLGVARRPLFTACQLLGNRHKHMTLESAQGQRGALQARLHGARVPADGFGVWSAYLCAGNPYSLQHSSYTDPGQMDKFQLRLHPDPAVFADNSAVLGNNGGKDGGPTVAGGQQVLLRVWGEGRNFLIVRDNTCRVAFQ
jgi:hypothetical protein